jgi:hypothetical protein
MIRVNGIIGIKFIIVYEFKEIPSLIIHVIIDIYFIIIYSFDDYTRKIGYVLIKTWLIVNFPINSLNLNIYILKTHLTCIFNKTILNSIKIYMIKLTLPLTLFLRCVNLSFTVSRLIHETHQPLLYLRYYNTTSL